MAEGKSLEKVHKNFIKKNPKINKILYVLYKGCWKGVRINICFFCFFSLKLSFGGASTSVKCFNN